MFKIRYLAVLWAVSLMGCATAPQPSREDDAVAAAQAAVVAMEGGNQVPAQGGTSGRTSPPVKVSKGKEPAWVSAPDAVYDKNIFVTAVGYGTDRNQAEKDALGRLVAVFGQSVQADLKTITSYSEAVSKGAVNVSENTVVQNAIKTSAEMDALIGAEIEDVWFDSKNTYYAVAVLEKAKASRLYTDMIRSNERIIHDLIAMSLEEKQTLDGFSRYQLAATIADVNRVYANVLTIVGGTSDSMPGDIKKGDNYRLEAMNITKSIPIQVRVIDDRSNRIKDAFASALTKQGFRSGGIDSRYVLQVRVDFSPVELPNQQNKFTRYAIEANLMDTRDTSVLLPFNINGREGHLSLSEAENRAVVAAEKKINDTYGTILSNYLASLLPNTK
ncbi:MAG: LPP20 family lipoprotein [Treponema sp.]|nr:LPP20 family lipoprotein [Treponema sp.]